VCIAPPEGERVDASEPEVGGLTKKVIESESRGGGKKMEKKREKKKKPNKKISPRTGVFPKGRGRALKEFEQRNGLSFCTSVISAGIPSFMIRCQCGITKRSRTTGKVKMVATSINAHENGEWCGAAADLGNKEPTKVPGIVQPTDEQRPVADPVAAAIGLQVKYANNIVLPRLAAGYSLQKGFSRNHDGWPDGEDEVISATPPSTMFRIRQDSSRPCPEPATTEINVRAGNDGMANDLPTVILDRECFGHNSSSQPLICETTGPRW